MELGELDEARAVADAAAASSPSAASTRGGCVTRSAAARRPARRRAYDEAAASALAAAAAELRPARAALRPGAHAAVPRAARSGGCKQWGAARESLEAAAAAFDELGSAGWASGRARSSRASAAAGRAASGELTPTERDVVELAAGGLANKEIARRLHLAVHTVEVHLSRAYAKLGVRSRAPTRARGCAEPA